MSCWVGEKNLTDDLTVYPVTFVNLCHKTGRHPGVTARSVTVYPVTFVIIATR